MEARLSYFTIPKTNNMKPFFLAAVPMAVFFGILFYLAGMPKRPVSYLIDDSTGRRVTDSAGKMYIDTVKPTHPIAGALIKIHGVYELFDGTKWIKIAPDTTHPWGHEPEDVYEIDTVQSYYAFYFIDAKTGDTTYHDGTVHPRKQKP